MSTMIGHSEFLEILRAEFPDLRQEFESWAEDDYPDHLLMMELHVFFKEGVANDDWARVDHCLSVLDRIFKGGDHAIRNVVYVSFLELIDLSKPPGDRLKQLMSPELLHGHAEIDEYLIQSGTRKQSYGPATT